MQRLAMALVLLVAGSAGCIAEAQTVYRCGATYSQTPCAGARPIDTEDPRSVGQVADARDRAAREQRQADRMEQDRLRREATFKPALATGFDSRSAPIERPHAVVKSTKKKQHRPARAMTADDSEPSATARSRGFTAAP